MKVLTEEALRLKFKNKLPKRYVVNSNVLVTPSARQFLRDKNIEMVVEDMVKENTQDDNKNRNKYEELEIPAERIVPKYISYYSGGALESKPEHMTQIYGNKLVFKDDPRIIFRGKLDSLQSKIIELQVFIASKNIIKLVEDLDEVLNYTREILKAEVLEEEFNIKSLIGLREEQLREMSHHPKKYFRVDHILPNYKMGEVLVGLNSLRSTVREVELTAIKAFRKDFELTRIDIIRALNRLSSCIYIMMCKHKAGLYK
ncbi:cobalamin adenosyltransferase [Paramaledivibacter caminithermalis]|uniref:Ethanolamine utilization cobalamin adenosyltransferase n=1 Tax=Paramaledivibacter caminithermalis (strain DSM 15212 / CIP 107654 / DViRD3) TaxID=1121301 RepID=A0A1M6PNV1_PARC5|nr:cobalamin adenosyltransferase [Paramaledivibacter caminithermalis]SHK09528.1 ethanolamine utilization cobalamin adenosyltransferase [Paramaledivibacter caminithermalis DSM 15212]